MNQICLSGITISEYLRHLPTLQEEFDDKVKNLCRVLFIDIKIKTIGLKNLDLKFRKLIVNKRSSESFYCNGKKITCLKFY